MDSLKTTVNVQCENCTIRHRAVCSYCNDSELDRLDSIKYYKTFSAGQSIANTSLPMSFVGSVVTGVASLSQTMEDGRTQMVGMLLPSDFVGRPGRDHVVYDVVATTDVTICCFKKKPFEQLMIEMPKVVQRLLEMTLDELDAAREWMLVLGRKTAREKIASFLLIFAQRAAVLQKSKPKMDIEFDLPLSREQMSDYLGLTLETVSRQINALKKDGIVEMPTKRHILVPDLSILLAEAGDDADGGFYS